VRGSSLGSNVRFGIDSECRGRRMQCALRGSVHDGVVTTRNITDTRARKAIGKLRGPRNVARAVPGGGMNAARDDARSRGNVGREPAGETEAQDRAGARCRETLELACQASPVDAAGDTAHAGSARNARFEREPARNQHESVTGLRLRGRRAHIPSRILGSDPRRWAR